jgi:hypothetical protein
MNRYAERISLADQNQTDMSSASEVGLKRSKPSREYREGFLPSERCESIGLDSLGPPMGRLINFPSYDFAAFIYSTPGWRRRAMN